MPPSSKSPQKRRKSSLKSVTVSSSADSDSSVESEAVPNRTVRILGHRWDNGLQYKINGLSADRRRVDWIDGDDDAVSTLADAYWTTIPSLKRYQRYGPPKRGRPSKASLGGALASGSQPTPKGTPKSSQRTEKGKRKAQETSSSKQRAAPAPQDSDEEEDQLVSTDSEPEMEASEPEPARELKLKKDKKKKKSKSAASTVSSTSTEKKKKKKKRRRSQVIEVVIDAPSSPRKKPRLSASVPAAAPVAPPPKPAVDSAAKEEEEAEAQRKAARKAAKAAKAARKAERQKKREKKEAKREKRRQQKALEEQVGKDEEDEIEGPPRPPPSVEPPHEPSPEAVPKFVLSTAAPGSVAASTPSPPPPLNPSPEPAPIPDAQQARHSLSRQKRPPPPAPPPAVPPPPTRAQAQARRSPSPETVRLELEKAKEAAMSKLYAYAKLKVEGQTYEYRPWAKKYFAEESWDELVHTILAVHPSMDNNDEVLAFVVWEKDRSYSWLPMDVVRYRCPLKLIDMFELTLVSSTLYSEAVPDDDDEDELEDTAAEDALTLESLPPELLLVIVEYAAPPTSVPHQRSQFLLALSHLSRVFRPIAQATLFSSLVLSRPSQASRWLTSPLLGVYATRRLDLAGVHAGEGLSAAIATRVIAKAVGVQWLRLQDFKRLSCRLFASPSLSGLKTLVLQTPFPDKSSTLSLPSPLPFRLRTLHLFARSYSPTLLSLLLSSSSGSLTTLYLSISPASPPYDGLLDSFHLVAPSLVHLSLKHRVGESFYPLLSGCTALRELVCHPSIELGRTLDALPVARLRRLEVEVDYNAIEILRQLSLRIFPPSPSSPRPQTALASLEILLIRGVSHSELFLMGQGPFMARCREVGVRVLLDEDVGDGEGGRSRERRMFP